VRTRTLADQLNGWEENNQALYKLESSRLQKLYEGLQKNIEQSKTQGIFAVPAKAVEAKKDKQIQTEVKAVKTEEASKPQSAPPTVSAANQTVTNTSSFITQKQEIK